MTKKLKFYFIFVILIGALYLLSTIMTETDIDIKGVIVFTVLSVIAESLLIVTPGESAISVGLAINLAAILVLGVPEAAWVTSIGVMLRVVKHKGSYIHIFNFSIYKTLSNGANILLSTGMAGECYRLLGGVSGKIDLNNLFVPLMASIFVYVIINETIISCFMASLSGEPFTSTWLSDISWALKNCIFLAPLGILMAFAYIKYGLLGIFLFLGPLLLARYSYKLYVDMRRIYIETVESLSQAIEAKDSYTQGHSMRVSEYACALAGKMGLPSKRIENLKMAAILHDIGKIGIEENILNKPGKLTAEEYEKIKQHPVIGMKIIQGIDFLKEASNIIYSHHERNDGKGYPDGIKNQEINLEACILSVADVFDALTSERPYRGAMTVQEALDIIEQEKGKQFDSKIAEAFIKMIRGKKELDQGC